MRPGHIFLDIDRNQEGGLSISVGNGDFGYRVAGGKLNGGRNVESFEVDGEELIAKIREYMSPENKEGLPE